MNAVVKGYLRLMRPANLPTAASDILAGIAITGAFSGFSLANFSNPFTIDMLLLIIASVLLYAGGVVLNDVFDVELDKVERPERAIPSGLISLKAAAIFGAILLLAGVALGFVVGKLSGIIAIVLAVCIVLYDYYAKHKLVLGPLNMGICRGLNLLLGISVLGSLHSVEFAIIPIIYIAAITLISKGEVHGDNKKHILFAGALYAVVLLGIAVLVFTKTDNLWNILPFLLLFAFLIYRPLVQAYKNNSPQNIKKAVIGGVLSLIVLDATIAVGFSHFLIGILIILLLPLSILLSRLFSVT